MASSGNFNTYSPINVQGPGGPGSYTGSEGLTGGDTTQVQTSWVGTHFAFPSGKWYFEVRKNAATGGWPRIGFYGMGGGGDSLSSITTETSNNLSSLRFNQGDDTMNKYVFGSTSSSSVAGSISNGDILQVAVDIDNGKIWYGVNNTYLVSGDPAGDSNPIDDYTQATYNPLQVCVGTYNGPDLPDINFGQDSTFRGQRTAGGNADGNGFGDFAYSPPTGFLAMCTANLPISDDIDPAQTDDNIGEKQVNAVTYTGNGSSVNVTGFGFAPDFVWVKSRSPDNYNNMIFDSSRGVHKHLSSDRAATEFNTNTSLTSFDSDGYTYGSETSGNDSGDSFIAWGWRANGGTTATNNDGSVTSTVQANQAAGFSIVTFTGINSATTATVGHGLGKAPTAIMHFCRTSATYPFFRIKGATNASTVRSTNPNGSPTDVSGSGGALSDPTSSVFSINNYTGIGGGGFDYVAYCWAPIEGYSKFGNFTGNGNADGPFIYTGFRPKIVVLIAEPYGRENFIYDTIRDTGNPIKTYLRWGRTNTESSNSAYVVDFLSNGFKIRGTFGGDINGSDENNFYMAWGDVPFKYGNIF